MNEKRKHVRIPAVIVVELHDHKDVSRQNGFITDLSLGGMGFESDAELEQNTDLFMTFNMPVQVQGKITHVKKSGHLKKYGVEFRKLGDVEKLHLEKFVTARFKKS